MLRGRTQEAALMTTPPRSALILGLAGLIPFVWSAVTQLSETAAGWTMQMIGPRFVGPYMGLFYGTIILAFMSGVLWGFGPRRRGDRPRRVMRCRSFPPLWAFFFVGGGPDSAAVYLMAGFAGLLMIDAAFARAGARAAVVDAAAGAADGVW